MYEPLNVVAKQFPHVSKARETEILNLTHQSQIQHVITCLTLITYKHCPIKSNLEGVHLCFLKQIRSTVILLDGTIIGNIL